MGPEAGLTSDSNVRVGVFIDGQNLYKACRRMFGHPLCHPHLLAEYLAGPQRKQRVTTRFYTGRPNPNIAGERSKTRNLDRRLEGMRRQGVTVITCPLRYHWDWGHRERLPLAEEGADPQTVTLRPWRRPQEKGIDLVLALDVLEFILTETIDVAIVVSFDRDLHEIPQALHNLRRFVNRPVRIEAGIPVLDGQVRTLKRFSRTHWITREVFELIRDDTDYTVSKEAWTRTAFPKTLADLRRKRRR